MHNENVIQANPSCETIREIKPTKRIYERFGVSPCHLGPDGKRVGSEIMINMTVKTNESKEMLLSYDDTLRNLNQLKIIMKHLLQTLNCV